MTDEEKTTKGTGFSQRTESEEEPIVALPKEEIALLLDRALRSDLRSIANRAIQLKALDKQWVPFATHLRQLAKGFKGKQIREFFKQY